MAMQRLIDGEVVDIPAEEEAQLHAEWAAAEAEIAAKQASDTARRDRVAALEASARQVAGLDAAQIAARIDDLPTIPPAVKGVLKEILALVNIIADKTGV